MNNQNQYISDSIVNLLAELGCKNACISPGARNTPIIFALDKNQSINTYSILDERSAGFFALGIAKKTRKPVILNCTSGTALANFLPAIIEARMSQIPIIILTADRPKKLLNTGENQTIFQNNFYGKYVLNSIEVECIDDDINSILKNVNKAYNACLGITKKESLSEKGPVHINIHIEEPLLSEPTEHKKHDFKIDEVLINKNTSNNSSLKTNFQKPIIVCGQTDLHHNRNNIFKLSEQINAPILSDISSNIHSHNNTIQYYDHYIEYINPDLIFRFGKKPLSKRLNNILKNLKDRTYLITQRNIFNDDVKNTISIDEVLNRLDTNKVSQEWLNLLKDYDNQIQEKISNSIKNDNIHEYNFAFKFISHIPNQSNIFIGNSLMIRAFDSHSDKFGKDILFFSNRGASGIDGNISTALGISKASPGRSNFLIIGDQAFMHDLGSLQLLKELENNLTIIIINNMGGAIFDYLNLSNSNVNSYEKFIRRSHKMNFKSIVHGYDLKYTQLNTLNDLSKISSGNNIYEVSIDVKNR